ncbi:MAG: phosphoribosylglycinamide formyltransferase [Rhodobacteraceae bacterium]|nr:phosphoribosylglycinamide formyltransferase [Paracoccaceae bacterium]
MRSPNLNLGFFASHNGTGMRAVVKAIRSGVLLANPKVVISNNASAPALDFASENRIAAFHVSQRALGADRDLDAELLRILVSQEVDIIVLSGYLRKLGPKILRHFGGSILNVHPSLLPKFGGKGMYGAKVHRAVLDAGETESGATVHLVEAEYDSSKTICQKEVSVAPGETPETLARSVESIEGDLLIEALNKIAKNSMPLTAI